MSCCVNELKTQALSDPIDLIGLRAIESEVITLLSNANSLGCNLSEIVNALTEIQQEIERLENL